MTAALLTSPPSLFAAARRSGPADRRGVTLEERLEWSWRAVQAEGRAECPVCRAGMRSDGSVARCSGCGSKLA
jgi:tRNA(Ile2) C34 agmatinyltransferase TiaS